MPNTNSSEVMAPPGLVNFGVEVETIRRSRGRLAGVVATRFGGRAERGEDARLADGRSIGFKHDGSLSCSTHAEMVTPIMKMVVDDDWRPVGGADADILVETCRAIRADGAQVDASCGIHVHIDAHALASVPQGQPGHDESMAKGLVALTLLVHRWEARIVRALRISPRRLLGVGGTAYCRALPSHIIPPLLSNTPRTVSEFKQFWSGQNWGPVTPGRSARWGSGYHIARYHGLNMHALEKHQTVEFRWFEATLRGATVQAYAQFCVGLALLARRCVAEGVQIPGDQFPVRAASEKADMRLFLHMIGLSGDEFTVTRQVFLGHLSGEREMPSEDAAPLAAAASGAGA